MRMTVYWPASHGERFDPEAFAGNVGKVIPVRLDDDRIAGGTIIKAEADANGVNITFDVNLPDGWPVSAGPYELLQDIRGTSHVAVTDPSEDPPASL